MEINESALKRIFLKAERLKRDDANNHFTGSFEEIMRKMSKIILPIAHLVPKDYWDKFHIEVFLQSGVVNDLRESPKREQHDNPKELERKYNTIERGLKQLSPYAKEILKSNINYELIENEDAFLINKIGYEERGYAGDIILDLVIKALSRRVEYPDVIAQHVVEYCKDHLTAMNLTPNTSTKSDSYKVVVALTEFWQIANIRSFSPNTTMKKIIDSKK